MNPKELMESIVASRQVVDACEAFKILSEQVDTATFINDRGTPQRIRDTVDAKKWLLQLAQECAKNWPRTKALH